MNRMSRYRSPAPSVATPTSTAPLTADRGRDVISPSPTAATGISEASASAPRGPPDRRSAASPPTNAHQTASRAPAATDQEAATSTGRLGRAPATDTNGTTDPWRSAAASGMTMASPKRTEPSSGNGG